MKFPTSATTPQTNKAINHSPDTKTTIQSNRLVQTNKTEFSVQENEYFAATISDQAMTAGRDVFEIAVPSPHTALEWFGLSEVGYY